MKFCQSIRNMSEFNTKILKIEELENNRQYDRAFEALVVFIQILNIYIIKNKLRLKEDTKNDFFDFINTYEKNKLDNLTHYMLSVLSIYEEYPSDYIDLDFQKLKTYTDLIVNEVF